MFAIVGGCSGGSGAGGTAASNKSSLSGGNPEKASNLVVSVAYRMGDSYRSPDKDLKCEPAEALLWQKAPSGSGVEVCFTAAGREEAASN